MTTTPGGGATASEISQPLGTTRSTPPGCASAVLVILKPSLLGLTCVNEEPVNDLSSWMAAGTISVRAVFAVVYGLSSRSRSTVYGSLPESYSLHPFARFPDGLRISKRYPTRAAPNTCTCIATIATGNLCPAGHISTLIHMVWRTITDYGGVGVGK